MIDSRSALSELINDVGDCGDEFCLHGVIEFKDDVDVVVSVVALNRNPQQ